MAEALEQILTKLVQDLAALVAEVRELVERERKND
jgi:hypothetical protein